MAARQPTPGSIPTRDSYGDALGFIDLFAEHSLAGCSGAAIGCPALNGRRRLGGSIGAWVRANVRPDPCLADQRGRRVMFVSHCLLNENTRYAGGAFTPGAVPAVIDHCLNANAGIVQMPCPEQVVWGGVLKRWMWLAVSIGRHIPPALRDPVIGVLVGYTRVRYRSIARRVARQVNDYASSGFTVVAVIGVDGSPSCGVSTRLNAHATLNAMMDSTPRDQTTFNREIIAATAQEGSGWFTHSLRAELNRRHLAVPFHAFDLLEEMRGSTAVQVTGPRTIRKRSPDPGNPT